MLSPETQTNLKNAKSYFEEHLCVGDYYTEGERARGEWLGAGATWAEEHLFERRSVVHEQELRRHALAAAHGGGYSKWPPLTPCYLASFIEIWSSMPRCSNGLLPGQDEWVAWIRPPGLACRHGILLRDDVVPLCCDQVLASFG